MKFPRLRVALTCVVLLLSLFSSSSFAEHQTTYVYVWPWDLHIESIKKNHSFFDGIMPFVYTINEKGELQGQPDNELLNVSALYKLEVMPVVWNNGFTAETMNKLLDSEATQKKLIESLLVECAKYHYKGIQFDFEGIPSSQRDRYSQFVSEAGRHFSSAEYALSVAVVPTFPDVQTDTPYVKWYKQYWSGAYDISALSKSVNFLTLMAYDQHTVLTPPGPIGGSAWGETILKSINPAILSSKISLGIPLYGRHWAPRPSQKQVAESSPSLISFDAAVSLASMQHTKIAWDPEEKAPWYSFYRNGIREYVHFMNAEAVAERVTLGKRYGITHFSLFVLGKEDSKIFE